MPSQLTKRILMKTLFPTRILRAISLGAALGAATAEPMATGVSVTEKKDAVKVELEVTPPANADALFFRVGFGD